MRASRVSERVRYAFDTVETEANFTTRISSFYKEVIIDVKRGDRRRDIVLITPNIEQAEQMLAEFDNACGDQITTEPNEDDVHTKRVGT
nr:unnamed protein product [Haemonchus contortus]